MPFSRLLKCEICVATSVEMESCCFCSVLLAQSQGNIFTFALEVLVMKRREAAAYKNCERCRENTRNSGKRLFRAEFVFSLKSAVKSMSNF